MNSSPRSKEKFGFVMYCFPDYGVKYILYAIKIVVMLFDVYDNAILFWLFYKKNFY